MATLTDYTSYEDAQAHFSKEKLWELFDGDRETFNIAHECVDRHADSGRDALIIVNADGPDETITYAELARASSQFAHFLESRGCKPGDRVAIMLEPSRPFYVAMFGSIKAGMVAVPLFTLFGPEGVRLRVDDCTPSLLITTASIAATLGEVEGPEVIAFDETFAKALNEHSSDYPVNTRADATAAFQYTSGTTRELPEAVAHSHKTLVTLLVAGLYGTGLRPGDRFICPSSPAWGHGLWHGTLAPMALGLTIGTYAGRFDAEVLLRALQEHRFTNMSAAATHYRMMRNSGVAGNYDYCLEKVSFTGEPIDSETADFARETFGHEVCSMYGTTEIGVVLVNYPGAEDFEVKPGSLGKPPPGQRVEVQEEDGTPTPVGETGFLMVHRRGQWIPTRDLAQVDEGGYFYHCGRADDVIISAGWTMSAVEIENAMLMHPDVREAAAIGVPDELRGQVVKAFVVSERDGSDAFTEEVQDLVRSRLSAHEYPRLLAFVSGLPKTPAGKINRKVLRDRESEAL